MKEGLAPKKIQLRFQAEELGPVAEALRLRLEDLLKEKTDFIKAGNIYKVLWRFERSSRGRPGYPKHLSEKETWARISSYLEGPRDE